MDLHDEERIGLKDIFRCLIENIRFQPPDYTRSITVNCRQCRKAEFCLKLRKLVMKEWGIAYEEAPVS